MCESGYCVDISRMLTLSLFCRRQPAPADGVPTPFILTKSGGSQRCRDMGYRSIRKRNGDDDGAHDSRFQRVERCKTGRNRGGGTG